jgi:mRNA interferase YafQ
MREIVRTSAFKADFKREKKGKHRETIEADLAAVLELLVADKALPGRCRDHALGGEWKPYRDCHLKPDLLLIYRKVDPEPKAKQEKPTLELARLGSHSELGF